MDQLPQVSDSPNKLWVYGLLTLVGIIGAMGDVAVNQWAKSHRWEWWFISCVVWIGAATLFGYLLRWHYFAFGVAVILALLVHSVCVLLFDFIWEKVSLSYLQWIGVICAVLAFCFIEIGRKTPPKNEDKALGVSTSRTP